MHGEMTGSVRLMSFRLIGRVSVALISVIGLVLPAASGASAAAVPAGPSVQCVASDHAYDGLAIRMAHDIDGRLAGRVSAVGLEETDSRTGITCQYHASMHFYAASAIKVTILAALLRKAQEQHRQLTASEKSLAWLMITQSDNDAATALWNDVGIPGMQHFLNLAKMSETMLSDAWGLTLLTAHDETLLLHLISIANPILSKASRVYERYLMAHVISAQRWGTPAGAPTSVIVHVKNGWLPFGPGGWVINSLGLFTNKHRVYSLAFLTYDNPSMIYGVDTIEGAAEVIHRDLNPGAAQVIPPSVPGPSWGIPDEPIPPAADR